MNDRIKELVKEGVITDYRIKTVNIRRLPDPMELLHLVDKDTLLRAAKWTLTDLERTMGKAKFSEIVGPSLGCATQERLEKA